MFADIENIQLRFSSSGSRRKHVCAARKNHILVFRTSGCGMHIFDEETVKSPEGTILFVPDGASYSFEPVGDEPCCSVSVTFSADIASPRVMLFESDNFSGMVTVAKNICKQFHMRTPASRHMCLSLLHSVFAHLVTLENLSYRDKRKGKLIEPALNYMNENFCNPTLEINKLHLMCGISSAYFRRIFKANTNFTPQKYIEDKRLEYAFSLINETNYPISEISRMSGYNDPLYFGKVFKNKYGVSPSYVNTLML